MEMSLDSPPVSSPSVTNVTVTDLAAAQSGRGSSLRCFVTARGGRSVKLIKTVPVLFALYFCQQFSFSHLVCLSRPDNFYSLKWQTFSVSLDHEAHSKKRNPNPLPGFLTEAVMRALHESKRLRGQHTFETLDWSSIVAGTRVAAALDGFDSKKVSVSKRDRTFFADRSTTA